MSRTMGPAGFVLLELALGALLGLAPPMPAGAAVTLPPGETLLADVGTSRVYWQSYGKEPVAMPIGSDGHDPVSGTICADRGQVHGRRTLAVHPPWRVPTGKVYVDHSITLPTCTPIRLSLAFATTPEAAAPGKSDGVTFSCIVLAQGTERELVRRHHTTSQWAEERFDLSSYAGKTLVVRLQAEPGPKNNTAYDSARFADAKITIGSVEDARALNLKQMTSTRAYRATARGSLKGMGNTPAQGVTPSNMLPFANRLESADGVWKFSYQGEDCRVVYLYRPQDGTLDDFAVQVDDAAPFQPAQGGGVTAIVGSAGATREVAARGGKAVEVSQEKDANSLKVVWQYDLSGKPLVVTWNYRMVGKSLVVSARCDEPVVCRFSLGEMDATSLRKTILAPYLAGRVSYRFSQPAGVFVGRYLDWTASHASRCPQGLATYDPKTDGTRNAMVESGYVAVSPDVNEVLPSIPHPASPYLAVLGPRIMLDLWGHHKGTYQGDAENLRALKDHGVDHMAIISHVWQRYGYDVKLPDHLPADPRYGGDEGMIEFGRAANACGYVWSLHENYIDLYPDAPSYNPVDQVLLANGKPSPAWYNPGTKVQSFGLKCNRALEFAKRTAPEAHRRFGTTAAYLDVHTCVPPWHQLDHQADQPMAAMALAKMKYDTELFQFMRDSHGGPMFGEGANHFYWAGRCDGVEAQVIGSEDHSPFLDFDLLKIHPQMVNHGMGYYERWFRQGHEHHYRWGHDTGSMEQIDKYRAQELAYGHAGFIGSSQVDNVLWVVREHHLMHPAQRLYGQSRPTSIRYEVDGQLVSASAALVAGDTSRQQVCYESGLVVFVNWRKEPWQVEGRVLPQWGVLALGPQTEVATELRQGKWADYAECPEYLFADARTSFEMPYMRRKQVEPQLESFKYLGKNVVQVTYRWVVGDTLDADYHCFVHGCDRSDPELKRIDFQQDHVLPKPTGQWKRGEVVVDGPYEIRIPDKADDYALVVGLFNGQRVGLAGWDRGGNRIEVARLRVTRREGQITDIQAQKITAADIPPEDAPLDFRARLNPVGTEIDFGKLATDGSVKINREQGRLVVFPYPREKVFRVRLDLKAFAAGVDPSRIRVQAVAAGTGQVIGPAAFAWENDRLVLPMGAPGVGRYVVSWD